MKRLSLGFGLLVFMLIVMGALSLGQVSLIASRSNEVTDDLMPKQKRLAQMANEVNLIARAMRNIVILESVQALQTQRAATANSKRLIQADFTALDKVLLHPEMRQSFQRLLETRTDSLASQEKFFTILQSGSHEEARRVLLDESRDLQRRYMDVLAALQDQRTAVDVAEIATAVTLVQRIALSVMAASALLTVTIVRSMTQPLRHAVGIRVSGRSETTELLQALADMRHRLAQVVGTVREGAESVATASAQIAQGNADLSSRTEQQASALEETSATMEQVGSAASQNADHARQTSQFAVQVRDVALQGGEMVRQGVKTMQAINASSRQIGNIVGVVDSIAFQTNILALNAAVEAAGAGEQGRGFAVVADEVRNLAQRNGHQGDQGPDRHQCGPGRARQPVG